MALQHETEQATPTRRVRVKRETVALTSSDKNQLTRLVNEYSELQIQIDEAIRRQREILPDLHAKMRATGTKKWGTDLGEAERVIPVGRSTTLIDKQAFREVVSDEEFMDCITVGVTKAKEVLSGKELASISETIPPAKKPEEVKVRVFKPSNK
jgi:hypothetical protein